VAQVRAIVQRAGTASRMASAAFRDEFTRNPSLQRMLYRYTDSLLAQAIQIAVCSRFHVLEARLARSLLVTRDRLQSDKFHLTHEFLAHALGVRRVGVTKAASALQQQGLIIYSRGNIEILDVPGLAASSCKCYEIVKEAGTDALSTAFI
jgi:CRP-like cAMP-binding protein